MIGYLRGRLVHKQPPFLLIDVGGVGYELEAPMSTFYNLPDDEQVALYVHLAVREDAHLLFGFSDLSQREFFRRLIKITGIGPRVALAVLSTLNAEQFRRCIENEDVAALTRVPGIGGKTAQRIIFDLRGNLPPSDSSPDGSRDRPDPVQDAIGALLSLGYKTADAHRAVHAVADDIASEGDDRREALIRGALQVLSAG